MPLFMDRHEVSDNVTAEMVADLHQKDLEIEDKFNCKGLTYWFGAKRKTAFCLVEAPDKSAIQKMHDFAHGDVANQIIEVDKAIVESFLGRIEDPGKSQKVALNIINDPAFRTLMVICIKGYGFNPFVKAATHEFADSILKTCGEFKGSLVKRRADYFLISFTSVTQAVLCALEIRGHFQHYFDGFSHIPLKVALSAGVPVTYRNTIFEETIQQAERLCLVERGEIIVSSEVGDLFESENLNVSVNSKPFTVFTSKEEKFFCNFMDFIEKEYSNPALNTGTICRRLGYSKSHLYRKTTSVTGLSLNQFLKHYRLEVALKRLKEKEKNISEIAFETGFNDPAYFSKCFRRTFGILPSDYLRR